MSATPETDAQQDHPRNMAIDADRAGEELPYVVDADFARKLERERDEARRLASVYRSNWDRIAAILDEDPNPDLLPWMQ